nr:centrosomal protein of 97 kda [Hymenolepis microstoma]
MHGLENLSNITILNLGYNDISKIDTLNFIDGSQPSQEERSLVELISKYQPEDNESALIDFLSSLNTEPFRQGESRFRKQSETVRRIANSRACVLKKGLPAANELPQNLLKWNPPPGWLQRARSAQNLSDSVENLDTDSALGLRGSLREFPVKKRSSVLSYNFFPTSTSNQHLLRSESVFIPIESEDECPSVNDLKKSLQPSSSKSRSEPKLKPTLVPTTKEKENRPQSTGHRLKSPGVALTCFQRQTESSDSDEVKEEKVEAEPTLRMTFEKIDRLLIEETTEAPSPASDETFNVDPSICPARSPRGLETEIQLLRGQVEEFRAISAKQERERLQQADEIRRLAEEVRYLKAWKVSVLRGREILRNSAEGDCEQQRQGIKCDNSSFQKISEVISPTLVAINMSTTTTTENDDIDDVDIENSEEDEISEEESEEIVVDSPLPRPSSSNLNATPLTANLSTDSLETRRSSHYTPSKFETSSLYSVNLNEGHLISESTLLPTHLSTSN